jgi:hypothetical protein
MMLNPNGFQARKRLLVREEDVAEWRDAFKPPPAPPPSEIAQKPVDPRPVGDWLTVREIVARLAARGDAQAPKSVKAACQSGRCGKVVYLNLPDAFGRPRLQVVVAWPAVEAWRESAHRRREMHAHPAPKVAKARTPRPAPAPKVAPPIARRRAEGTGRADAPSLPSVRIPAAPAPPSCYDRAWQDGKRLHSATAGSGGVADARGFLLWQGVGPNAGLWAASLADPPTWPEGRDWMRREQWVWKGHLSRYEQLPGLCDTRTLRESVEGWVKGKAGR